jgi:hypothetical protein
MVKRQIGTTKTEATGVLLEMEVMAESGEGTDKANVEELL